MHPDSTSPTDITQLHVLGQILGTIIAESRRADAARTTSAVQDPRVDARERANEAARDAVERLILATKAASLADAAVHALHLRHLADDVETAVRDGNDAAAQRALWTIERLARSIFDALTEASGVDPAELGADYFVRPASSLWPPTAAGDLFGAAVSLFEAENGPMLSVPAKPGLDVLDAVAGAAGVTADAVRKVFVALGSIAKPMEC